MNKQQFGEELKQQLEKGYNIVNVSRWAFRVYSEHSRDYDHSTAEMLEYLFRMEDDPQFEFTEKELNLIADKLIKGEVNPIQDIIRMKSEEHK